MHFPIVVLLLVVWMMQEASGQAVEAAPSDSAQVVYKNKLLIFPIVALSKETSWVLGVANAYIFKTDKKDTALRYSTMPSGILYSLNNQIMVALAVNIFLPKERYIIRAENWMSKYPDRFWGIGNDTDEQPYESYTFTHVYTNPQFYRKVVKNFYLGIGFDFQRVFNIEYVPNGYFVQDSVLGVYDRTNYQVFGYSFLVNWDSRNHTYVPNKGELLRLRYTVFDTHMGSDYAFHALEVDYRKFIRITGQSTLGLHTLGLFNFGDPPLRNLALLGSNNIMRGYFNGRFRDNHAWAAQVEYRFPIRGRFGGVAFAATGQVAHSLGEFGLSALKPAIGAGVRYAVLRKEKLNLRFDVGFGSKGSINYYIVLAESF